MSNVTLKKAPKKKTRRPRKERTFADVQKDRLTFTVLRYFAGRTASEVVAGTEHSSENKRPVSDGTIRNLRRPIKDGGTRYPRASTLQRILEAHGASLEVVKEGKVWK